MRSLVLASGSSYRAAQLALLGIPFEADAPDIDETPRPHEPAVSLVLRLADEKARAIATRHPGAVIVSSDQVADMDGESIGKPGDVAEACAQLTRASGRTCDFLTAVRVHRAASPGNPGLIRDAAAPDGTDLDPVERAGEQAEGVIVVTRVTFRTLSAAEIERYVARDRPLDCAGAFKIEALGIALFERVESDDPTALIGLPLIATSRLLRARGFAIP